MHIVINHQINDQVKWDRSAKNIMSMIEQNRLPAGFKPLQYLPSADGHKAVCLWEAGSLRALQEFVDRETAGARNEYFEVKAEAAVGLPKGEDLARAA
jgi:DNA polymerase/3'-5' exonuclease PolX